MCLRVSDSLLSPFVFSKMCVNFVCEKKKVLHTVCMNVRLKEKIEVSDSEDCL